jgi:hypothetical protein
MYCDIDTENKHIAAENGYICLFLLKNYYKKLDIWYSNSSMFVFTLVGYVCNKKFLLFSNKSRITLY